MEIKIRLLFQCPGTIVIKPQTVYDFVQKRKQGITAYFNGLTTEVVSFSLKCTCKSFV